MIPSEIPRPWPNVLRMAESMPLPSLAERGDYSDADISGDQLPDVIASNKTGLQLFVEVRE